MAERFDSASSFTSADALPGKLLRDHRLIKQIVSGKVIPPIHAQFIPTNRCNLSCSFCSCSGEDRSLEMGISQAKEAISLLSQCGMKAVTITGGGDPLMHPGMAEIIQQFRDFGVSIGLVTNGTLFHKISATALQKVTWCRVSYGDARGPMTEAYRNGIIKAVLSAPAVDWAFSYVVSPSFDIDSIREIIEFAREMHFTHVRLVADLTQPEAVPMGAVEMLLPDYEPGGVPVIIQGRDRPERGKDCYICYLKPLVGPDLKVYACCGVQYALAEPSNRLPEELCLGDLHNWPEIMANSQESFEGAQHCARCYYGIYNRVLKMLVGEVRHVEFI